MSRHVQRSQADIWGFRALIVCAILILILISCLQGCKTPTAVVTEGPKNNELIEAQLNQIAELRAQLVAKESLLGAVAGNVYGIKQGAERVEPSKGREIVENEAGLAEVATGQASPEKKAEADARILATVKGDLEEQKRLYGVANSEVGKLKSDLEARDKVIAERDAALTTLKAEAEKERVNGRVELERVLREKDAAIAEANEKHRKGLQAWAARILIGAGIAVIIGCGAMLFLMGIGAASKAIPGAAGGLLLVGSGIIVGHPWFPWVAGTAVLALIVWGWISFRHLKKTSDIERQLRASVQDMKDEAKAGIPKAVEAFNELKSHLEYRIRARTGLEREIDNRLVAEGVNEKAAA